MPKFAHNVSQLPLETYYPFIYQVYFMIPNKLNCVIESFRTLPYNHNNYPALTVLSELLYFNFLQNEICRKGGAQSTGI